MMQIHGTIARNLRDALASAKRLKGGPIHPDTIQFWADLCRAARAQQATSGGSNPEVDQGVAGLELVIWSARGSDGSPVDTVEPAGAYRQCDHRGHLRSACPARADLKPLGPR